MTRDLAAVGSLDDRRRRRCPISAASSVVDDGLSPTTNGVGTTSGSSSNSGGDDRASFKSSSTVSTTTSCCGSSSPRSCSDDDDSAARVVDDGCHVSDNAKESSSLHDLNHAVVYSNGDKNSTSTSNLNDTSTADAATNIGGRLTFYKDGKFIFQLAAHQKHTHKNQLATTAQCRWVPVSTVIQQHKTNVKRFGESSSQNYQNKTIWPHLVTDQHTSDMKSTLPLYQSQSMLVTKSEDCMLQQEQLSQCKMTPLPLTPFSGAVNLSGFNNSVVMATTTNVIQRPSRKYSTSSSILNITDFLHQNRQPKSLHLRTSSKCLQYHQNQSFMMIATKAIKVLRRSKQRQHYRIRSTERTVIESESLLPKIQQQLPVNLENIVRNLWCRRHTSELWRRQISSNNNFETVVSTKSSVGSQRDCLDPPCLNVMIGSKRRSLVSPLPNTIYNESVISTTINNCNASSGPNKKYKLGPKQQQQTFVNNGFKITNPTMSANNHSITAILSSNVSGTKRGNGSTTTKIDPNSCFVTNTISTSSNLFTSQKNNLTAQPSLLRTLLKSSSCETRLQPVLVNSNDIGHKKHHSTNSINKSTIKLTSPLAAPKANISRAMATEIVLPPTLSPNVVNDATATHTSLQLPLHHATAAEQLTAAGYFNVLYHQAAMVYQNHSQMSQPLLKPIPLPKSQSSSLLSTQFPISESVINSWQQQLNQQPPTIPLRKTATDGIAAAVSKSPPLKVVAPYSSPMTSKIVNCSSVFNTQERQLQQYEQVPSVDQPYMYHKFKLQQKGSKVQKNVTAHGMEYGANIVEKYRVIDSNDSITSIDCMPLNLSKDSAAENIVR